MNPLGKITAIKINGLQFQVCEVSPVTAADWLKRNAKNRKIKENTVDGYARDMKNDAWYLTHQGVAFDDAGNLIDGQHRLHAIVRSKKPVMLFVSAGWPTGRNGKYKTMDAVDRGANRSLADQLHLQHDLPTKEAGRVVQITNAIAAACTGASRVRKSSTDCVLKVFEWYRDEIRYVLDTQSKTHGIKSAAVSSVVVLGRVAWPDKTSDFLSRLQTGENLTRDNPVLHLRNYLMGEGQSSDQATQRIAISHALVSFVEGRKQTQVVVNSNAGLQQLLKLQGDRVEKIRKQYGAEAAVAQANQAAARTNKGKAPEAEETKPDAFNTSPTGDDAQRIGKSLHPVFSVTDLNARMDNVNVIGLWLADWRRRGWIESVGTREFRKTESFGK